MKCDYKCKVCGEITEVQQPNQTPNPAIKCSKCGGETKPDWWVAEHGMPCFSASCACAYGIDGNSGWCTGSGDDKYYAPVDYSNGDDGADEKMTELCKGGSF